MAKEPKVPASSISPTDGQLRAKNMIRAKAQRQTKDSARTRGDLRKDVLHARSQRKQLP